MAKDGRDEESAQKILKQMSLIRFGAIQLDGERTLRSIDEWDEEEGKGGATEAAYNSHNTEENKFSPGSP